jgi:hypothetical protein
MAISLDRFTAANRELVLQIMAYAITEFTIYARAYYDEPDNARELRGANEAIHRIAGHLVALTHFDEALTESRAAAILATLALLPPSRMAFIEGRLP